MAKISALQKQLQQRQQQARQAQQKAEEARKKIPKTSQKQLRGGGGLKGRGKQRQLAGARTQVEEHVRDIGKFEQETKQAEKELEAYSKTPSGIIQYAKEKGIKPKRIYGKLGRGYSTELLGYEYTTPHGTTTDWSPKQELIKDDIALSKSASEGQRKMGFTSTKAFEKALREGKLTEKQIRRGGIDPKALQLKEDLRAKAAGVEPGKLETKELGKGLTILGAREFSRQELSARRKASGLDQPRVTRVDKAADISGIDKKQYDVTLPSDDTSLKVNETTSKYDRRNLTTGGVVTGMAVGVPTDKPTVDTDSGNIFIRLKEAFTGGDKEGSQYLGGYVSGKSTGEQGTPEVIRSFTPEETEKLAETKTRDIKVQQYFTTGGPPEKEVTYFGDKAVVDLGKPIVTKIDLYGQGTGQLTQIELREIKPDLKRNILRRGEEFLPVVGFTSSLEEQVYLPTEESKKKYVELLEQYKKTGTGTKLTTFLREQQAEYKKDIGQFNLLGATIGAGSEVKRKEYEQLYDKLMTGTKGSQWALFGESITKAQKAGKTYDILGEQVSAKTIGTLFGVGVGGYRGARDILLIQTGGAIVGAGLGATATGIKVLGGAAKVAKPLSLLTVPTTTGIGIAGGVQRYKETGLLGLSVGYGVGRTGAMLGSIYGEKVLGAGKKLFKPIKGKKGSVQITQQKSEYVYDYKTQRYVKLKDLEKLESFKSAIKTGTKEEALDLVRKAARDIMRNPNLNPSQKQQALKNLYETSVSAKGGLLANGRVIVPEGPSGGIKTSGGVQEQISITKQKLRPLTITETRIQQDFQSIQLQKSTQQSKQRLALGLSSLTALSQKSEQLTKQQQRLALGLDTQLKQQLKSPQQLVSQPATESLLKKQPRKPRKLVKPIEPIKPFIPGIPSSQLQRIAKKVKEAPETFEAIGFRFGKQVSLAKGTKKEVSKKLSKFLGGTLGASGFLQTGAGKKITAEETGLLGKEFRVGKRSKFLVVEKKEKRLRKGTTGKEIQYFKSKSTKSRKKSRSLFGL